MGASLPYCDLFDTAAQRQDSGWAELSDGMRQVAVGWGLLLAGSVLGGTVLWLGTAGYAYVQRWGNTAERGAILLLGVVILGLSAVMGSGSILVGQWRCLMHAPERKRAKELMLVCITCVFVGSLLTVVAPFLGGVLNYQTLQQGISVQGLNGLERFRIFRGEKLLALVGVSLFLLGCLLFTQFLRAVADCLQRQSSVRNSDFFTLFMGVLVGGTAVAFLCVPEFTFRSNLLQAVAACWLLGIAWHVALISGVRKGMVRARYLPQTEVQAPHWLPGGIAPSSSPSLLGPYGM